MPSSLNCYRLVSLCIEGVDLNGSKKRITTWLFRLPLHRGSGFKHQWTIFLLIPFCLPLHRGSGFKQNYKCNPESWTPVSLCIEGVDLNVFNHVIFPYPLTVSLCIEGVDLNISEQRTAYDMDSLPLHRGSGFKLNDGSIIWFPSGLPLHRGSGFKHTILFHVLSVILSPSA